MSYSFSVQAATKADGIKAAEAEFDKMVESQPAHKHDKAAALANLTASLALLPDTIPEGQVYRIGLNGYISWAYNPGENNADPDPSQFNAIGVSTSLSIGLPY